jgi:hypothetical protein
MLSYAPGKLYGVSETSVRVRSDFWNESHENRELIRRLACFTNGDAAWPHPFAKSILVMSKDNPSGCVYFECPEEFQGRIKGLEPCEVCEGTGLAHVAFDEPCDDCQGNGFYEEAA